MIDVSAILEFVSSIDLNSLTYIKYFEIWVFQDSTRGKEWLM